MTSSFQQQYPLSPRKFWKKMLSGSAGNRGGVFSILIMAIASFAYSLRVGRLVAGEGPFIDLSNQMSSVFLWGSMALLGIVVLYFVVKAFYVHYYIRDYFYDVDNNAITIRKGVFTPQEIHVFWSRVQDVYVDQDLLDRLFGIYDVHLASATVSSGIEAHIDGVGKTTAEGLKNYLLVRINAAHTAPAISSPQTAPVATPGSVVSANISDDTYPIVGRWLVIRAFSATCLGLLVALVFGFLCVAPVSVQGTIADLFGMNRLAVIGWAIVAGIAVALINFAFGMLWRSSFSFSFGPEYLVKQEGVISRSEKHVPYRTVQDVLVSQGILERLLGIANVDIQNASQAGAWGGSFGIPGQPLDKANELSARIRAIVATHSQAQTGL